MTAYTESKKLQMELEQIYSTATVKDKSGKKYLLDPDLNRIMSTSRDYDELLWAWKSWRDESGKKMRSNYKRTVESLNIISRNKGRNSTADSWIAFYEMPDFEAAIDQLFQQILPHYKRLHAYVRKKLAEKYGENNFPTSGHIPAHLLGNMWAQTWNSIFDIVKPYPNLPDLDVTKEMVAQNYTVKQMFVMSDQFFQSLGLLPMPRAFWNNSIISRPTDGRQMVCHASAWDFFDGNDFRIKQCTQVTMDELFVVHHEMGHIQYFLQYRDQPIIFRESANPGFHEAIGDVMALSVSTPGHLHRIGLLDKIDDTEEFQINYLMKTAMEKLAFIPYAYTMDKYRWEMFRTGDLDAYPLNSRWWNMRCDYQGVFPPVKRTEDDFDPGAKYHIPAFVPYIRYFYSFILQFQIHEALCRRSGHQGPLHKCSINGSTAAGDMLRDALKLGSSRHWSVALETLTGNKTLSADSLIKYFQPLFDWLTTQINEDSIGWSDNTSCPNKSSYLSSDRLTMFVIAFFTALRYINVFIII